MAAGDVVNGPDGEEIDVLQVWEVLVERGGEQPWHRHHHPYLIVPLEGAENRVTTLVDGSIRDVGEGSGLPVSGLPVSGLPGTCTN